MIPDAFVPIRAEELTDVRVPQRLLNYGGLVDAIADKLVKDHVAVTKGYKAVGFGRWMRCGATTRAPKTLRSISGCDSTGRQCTVRARRSSACRSASRPVSNATPSSIAQWSRWSESPMP